jgi:hypothetical protein
MTLKVINIDKIVQQSRHQLVDFSTQLRDKTDGYRQEIQEGNV